MLNKLRVVSTCLVAVAAIGCNATAKREAAAMTGGNPDRGAVLVRGYGCGSCHTIPGISGAHGQVGPPLTGVGTRVYVAGKLPNQPGNLTHWVRDPQSVNEGTVMPNLGVTAQDATDIAAFLYSLR